MKFILNYKFYLSSLFYLKMSMSNKNLSKMNLYKYSLKIPKESAVVPNLFTNKTVILKPSSQILKKYKLNAYILKS